MATQDEKQSKAEAKAELKGEKARQKAMRPWYKKKRFIIPLAFVAVALIASLGTGGDGAGEPTADAGAENEADSDGATDTGEDEAGSDETTEARLGEPVRDGKFEFTVDGLECGVESVGEEFMTEEPQGQFCLLDVTVENIGDEAQYLFADNQYLYDEQGRQFSADGTATFAANPEGQALFEEINPGNSISGTIVFDVPQGATIVSAELHDSAFSNGIAVDLAG